MLTSRLAAAIALTFSSPFEQAVLALAALRQLHFRRQTGQGDRLMTAPSFSTLERPGSEVARPGRGPALFALLAVAAFAQSVGATQVTQDFTVWWDRSTPSFASFSYDDALVPAGGGDLANVVPLAALSIEIDGQSFSQADVRVVRFQFNADRSLNQVVFGNNCDMTRCSAVADDRLTWWVAFSGTPYFNPPPPWDRKANGTAAARDCALLGGCRYSDDAYVFAGRVTSVPEPATYALLLSALPLIVYASRRRAQR